MYLNFFQEWICCISKVVYFTSSITTLYKITKKSNIEKHFRQSFSICLIMKPHKPIVLDRNLIKNFKHSLFKSILINLIFCAEVFMPPKLEYFI